MSAVTDAFGNLQTALVNKLTALKSNEFFALDPADSTNATIKTTKNIKVIGDVTAKGDVLGNENIT